MAAAVLLLASAHRLAAQAPGTNDAWRWVRFGDGAGLPSDHVADVIEAADGTVWAVTERGLAWYDGYEWKPIGPGLNLAKPVQMSATPDTGRGVLVALAGRLYRGDTSGFREVALERNGAPVAVTNAVALAGGDLLIRAEGGALFRYAAGRLVPESVTPGTSPAVVRRLVRTGAGGVWIVTQDYKLFRWGGARWTRTAALTPSQLYIGEDDAGRWSAFVLAPESQRGYWEGRARLAPVRSDDGRDVVAYDVAPSGEMALVYSNSELRWRAARGEAWQAFSIPLRSGSVTSLRFRRNGDLWVMTTRGLYLRRRSSRLWTELGHGLSDPRNAVNEILRTRDGALWTATREGVEVRPSRGPARWIREIGTVRLDVVTGLAEDDAGGVWISSGASFDGAWRWDGIAWRHFGASDGLNAPRVHKIRRDRRGRLWFLGISESESTSDTAREPGAFVYDQGRFTRWGVAEGLPSGRVYSFGETTDGALWFGTYGGLSRWKGGAWTHWPGMPRVFTLTVGADNRVWFSDRLHGLAFIGTADQPELVGAADGLRGTEVWDLRVDSAGWLWATTRSGFGTYHDGAWSWIGAEGGLDDQRLWPVLPLEDRVYLGSTSGGVIALARDEARAHAPRVRIGQVAETEGHTTLRWSVSSYWGLPNEASLETRHRIDGGPWSPWGTEREAVIAGLRGGRHRVEVQAKGMLGDLGALVQQEFRVPLPLILRPGVAVPVGAALVGLIVLAGMLVVQKRRRDGAMRESEAKVRAILDAAPDAMLGVDETGRIVFSNAAATTLFGYTSDELAGLLVDALMPAGAAERHAAYRERFQARPAHRPMGVPGVELAAVRKDGTSFPAEISLSHLSAGGRSTVLASIRDITPRRELAEALRKSTQQRAAVLAAVPVIIFAVNEAQQFTLVEGMGMARMGLDPGQFLGQSVMKAFGDVRLIQRDGSTLDYAKARRRVIAGETAEGIASFVNEDYDVQVVPERDAAGRVIGAYGIAMSVTELRRAEKAVRESENRFRALAAITFAVVWRSGPDGQPIGDNASWCAFTGQSPEELRDGRWIEAIHPDDRDRVGVIVARAMAEGVPFRVEERLRRFDGAWRHMIVRSAPIRDAKGTVAEWIGAGVDVTESVEAELALRQSEARLLETQRLARLGSWELDLVNDVLTWSDETYELFEIDRGQGPNAYATFLNTIHPDDRALVDEAYRRSVADHQPYEVNHRLLMEDGRVKYVQERGQSFYDAAGTPVHSSGTIQDVTETRLAYEAIRSNEQRLRVALRMINMTVFQQDLALRYTWMMQPQRGYTSEDLVGRCDAELLPPETAQRVTALKRSVLETGKHARTTVSMPVGEESHVFDVVVEPLLDAEGRIVGLTGASLDVTRLEKERALLEASQRELRALTAHLNSVREEERAALARDLHDNLGQNLTALKMDLRSLRRKVAKGDGVPSQTLDAMDELVDTLIAAGRQVISDLHSPELEGLGLRDAVEQQADLFRRRTEVSCLVIGTTGALPLDERTVMAAYRVVQESLTNVARHARATAVTITLGAKEHRLLVRIEDNGLGCATAPRSGEQFGIIGMRERALALGGELAVRNRPEGGTKVELVIPVGEVAPARGNT